MNKQEYSDFLKLSTVPLRKLNEEGMPIGFASSCVVKYKEKNILLSVQHATGDMKKWAAEVKYVKDKGMQMYLLGPMNFLKSINITEKQFKDIDYSYVELPNNFESYYQHIEPTGYINEEIKRNINLVTFNEKPSKADTFGFYGQILPKHIGMYVTTKPVLYTNLEYIKTEDDYHIFRLPNPHRGHKYFKGCSGSPIINQKGEIVALVCHGDMETNLIYGISLNKYKISIDATFNDFGDYKQ